MSLLWLKVRDSIYKPANAAYLIGLIQRKILKTTALAYGRVPRLSIQRFTWVIQAGLNRMFRPRSVQRFSPVRDVLASASQVFISEDNPPGLPTPGGSTPASASAYTSSAALRSCQWRSNDACLSARPSERFLNFRLGLVSLRMDEN